MILLTGDLTLVAGTDDAAENLVSVKRLTRFVLFDNNERHCFDDLIGCEAFAAFLTFSAAAYGGTVR